MKRNFNSATILWHFSLYSHKGVKPCRRVRRTASAPSVSRLLTQCGILNVSQFYEAPHHVVGMASLTFSRKGRNVSDFIPLTFLFTLTIFSINILF
jgi:hypothetical protein